VEGTAPGAERAAQEMIVYESGGPVFRAGEGELAGRRVAGRLYPYAGEAGVPRFDPLARRFLLARAGGRVVAGPGEPALWKEAAARPPAGPVVVGPCTDEHDIRGSYRAAAEGALAAGRPVYLLDPSAAGLPACGAGRTGVVALCVWKPGPRPSFTGLRAATGAGLRSGALLPILPGWTEEGETLRGLLEEAASGGAASVTPVLPALDGEARRAIVEARAVVDPDRTDEFFELVHHTDWAARLPSIVSRIEAECTEYGLSTRPPRPVPEGGFSGNVAAAARLEERATALAPDEHRGALLAAAIRWLDESGRDLAAVAREGNFRKIFPFADELAREAEAALLAVR
jgi:hypothetical protein